MTTEIDPFLSRIRTAYGELGHNRGCRFLYTPASTFGKHTKVLFVALNPKGTEVRNDFREDYKDGNAFRLEKWGRNHERLNQLQNQVCAFYSLLGERLKTNPNDLMDQTMASNFCPFASPSWADLANREETLKFCSELWKEILPHLQPRVVVTIGSDAENQFCELLKSRGPLISNRSCRTSWGSVQFSLTRFEVSGQPTLLVGLPHLSRYKIFAKRRLGHWTAPLLDSIAEILTTTPASDSETSTKTKS